ncbi:hypothetical protein F5887DRAFT_36349 [Amanita rubescens]|nr:hypothetical protein F5887DRAFT_36349 [Amanita rubescens]
MSASIDLLPALFASAIASTNFHARPIRVVLETKFSYVLVETSPINQLMWMCWLANLRWASPINQLVRMCWQICIELLYLRFFRNHPPSSLCSLNMMFGNTFLRFALAALVAGNAVLAASVAINSPDPAALVNAEPADKNTADFVSGANASDKQADTAHCGWSSWPHSCWKYIGAGPHCE